MSIKKRRQEDIPFSFRSPKEADAACAALKRKYDGKIKAWATEMTLFVQAHDSLIMNYDIVAFVRSLGGTQVGNKV